MLENLLRSRSLLQLQNDDGRAENAGRENDGREIDGPNDRT